MQRPPPDGLLSVAHVHNADATNLSAGAAMSAAALADLFPDAVVYDDAELTRALMEARAPEPLPAGAAYAMEAFSLLIGDALPPRPVSAGLALPPTGARLCRNPLYGDDGHIEWPSDRYREEYASRATYPLHVPRSIHPPTDSAMRSREAVDLPERW